MTSMARKYLFATLAFLAAAAPTVSQVALADDKEPPKRTITMSGKGTVKSAPDKVTVSAGVESQAPTAKDALAKNTAAQAISQPEPPIPIGTCAARFFHISSTLPPA